MTELAGVVVLLVEELAGFNGGESDTVMVEEDSDAGSRGGSGLGDELAGEGA